jgi:hypothetical protein
MSEWKFSQPKNTAVIADRFFMEQKESCQIVTHDSDDGGWQFLTENTNGDFNRALVVALSQAISMDATLNELFDLPEGWIATRRTKNSAWERRPR